MEKKNPQNFFKEVKKKVLAAKTVMYFSYTHKTRMENNYNFYYIKYLVTL